MLHQQDSEGKNRRRKLRFPLNTELRFHVLRSPNGCLVDGAGIAENMSSRGLAFRTATPLESGTALSVSIAWPVLLDGHCGLRLVIEGTVVRVDGNLVVITIAGHEFRTSGRIDPARRQELADLARGMSMYDHPGTAPPR